jgi:hypothetical protein
MKEFFLNILINYFCLFERLTAWVEIAGEDFGDSAKAPGTFLWPSSFFFGGSSTPTLLFTLLFSLLLNTVIPYF